jgi:cell division septum initiation protein DivIVA
MANTIKIDGKDYELDALSDDTKRLLTNIRVVDREITRLRQQLAIAQTARASFANGIKNTLPAEEGAAA